MRKYPISEEFKAFSHFVPPMNRPFLKLAQKHMPIPKFLWQDPELDVKMRRIPVYQNGNKITESNQNLHFFREFVTIHL